MTNAEHFHAVVWPFNAAVMSGHVILHTEGLLEIFVWIILVTGALMTVFSAVDWIVSKK